MPAEYVENLGFHDGSLQPEDLMTAFFSVMMGSIALGQAGPQFAVLGAAQGAAASIFEVLDRVSTTSCNTKLDNRNRKSTLRVKVELLEMASQEIFLSNWSIFVIQVVRMSRFSISCVYK